MGVGAVARELVCVGLLCQLQRLACAVNAPQPAATVDYRGGALQPSALWSAAQFVMFPSACCSCRRWQREAHRSCVCAETGVGLAACQAPVCIDLATCTSGVHHSTR